MRASSFTTARAAASLRGRRREGKRAVPHRDPGVNDLLVRACIREGVDGIVVEGVGAGNVNVPFLPRPVRGACGGNPRGDGGAHLRGRAAPRKGPRGLVPEPARARGHIRRLSERKSRARILLMVALAHTQDRGELQDISSGRADERKEGGIAAVSQVGNSTFLTLKAQSSPPRGSLTFLSRRTLLPQSANPPSSVGFDHAFLRNYRHRVFSGMCQNPPPEEEAFSWNLATG